MHRQEKIKRRWIRQVLYAFRRTHGVPAEYYKLTSNPDVESGEKWTTRSVTYIPQFISGDITLARKFEYDIGFVKGNSNFTYGMLFEAGDRIGIIDGEYLDEVKEQDYVVYDDQRYNIRKIIKLDGGAGWILHLRHTTKELPKRIINKYVYSNLLDLTQEQTYEF